MISLFRRIRKGLLRDGKTAQYASYAVGEIVLVVIGILLALAINDCNNSGSGLASCIRAPQFFSINHTLKIIPAPLLGLALTSSLLQHAGAGAELFCPLIKVPSHARLPPL